MEIINIVIFLAGIGVGTVGYYCINKLTKKKEVVEEVTRDKFEFEKHPPVKKMIFGVINVNTVKEILDKINLRYPSWYCEKIIQKKGDNNNAMDQMRREIDRDLRDSKVFTVDKSSKPFRYSTR